MEGTCSPRTLRFKASLSSSSHGRTISTSLGVMCVQAFDVDKLKQRYHILNKVGMPLRKGKVDLIFATMKIFLSCAFLGSHWNHAGDD